MFLFSIYCGNLCRIAPSTTTWQFYVFGQNDRKHGTLLIAIALSSVYLYASSSIKCKQSFESIEQYDEFCYMYTWKTQHIWRDVRDGKDGFQFIFILRICLFNIVLFGTVVLMRTWSFLQQKHEKMRKSSSCLCHLPANYIFFSVTFH